MSRYDDPKRYVPEGPDTGLARESAARIAGDATNATAISVLHAAVFARPTIYTLHAPADYVAWNLFPSSETLAFAGQPATSQLVTGLDQYTQIRLLANIIGNRIGTLLVRACDALAFTGASIDASTFTIPLCDGGSDLTVSLGGVSAGDYGLADSGWLDINHADFTSGTEAVLGLIGTDGDDTSTIYFGSIVVMAR